jgi:glycosyltransferase involved in cell wall biosynthesis
MMRPLQVEVDSQVFLAQRRGGISRYFVELVRELRSDAELGVEVVLPWRWTANEHAMAAGLARGLPSVLRRRRVVEALNGRDAARSGPVHHTYYSRGSLLGPARRRAVTVHDMTPELFPELNTEDDPHEAKQAHVAAASLVLCVSQATARDLAEIYGPPAAPVVITPLGVGAPFLGAGRGDVVRPLPQPYLLHVGRRDGYKDFGTLVAALGLLRPDVEDLQLLAVGGGALTDAERQVAAAHGVADRLHHRVLTDSQLADAYAAAQCLAFPSRYEGFGLPALEAMASGCPVVISATPALQEVAGGAAERFTAGDAQDLAGALTRVLGEDAHRQELVQAGRARAAEHTWERTAQLTAAAYRSHLQ